MKSGGKKVISYRNHPNMPKYRHDVVVYCRKCKKLHSAILLRADVMYAVILLHEKVIKLDITKVSSKKPKKKVR